MGDDLRARLVRLRDEITAGYHATPGRSIRHLMCLVQVDGEDEAWAPGAHRAETRRQAAEFADSLRMTADPELAPLLDGDAGWPGDGDTWIEHHFFGNDPGAWGRFLDQARTLSEALFRYCDDQGWYPGWTTADLTANGGDPRCVSELMQLVYCLAWDHPDRVNYDVLEGEDYGFHRLRWQWRPDHKTGENSPFLYESGREALRAWADGDTRLECGRAWIALSRDARLCVAEAVAVLLAPGEAMPQNEAADGAAPSTEEHPGQIAALAAAAYQADRIRVAANNLAGWVITYLKHKKQGGRRWMSPSGNSRRGPSTWPRCSSGTPSSSGEAGGHPRRGRGPARLGTSSPGCHR